MTDFTFSLLISMCRMNAGADMRPLQVRLLRAAPPDPSPWLDFFGGDVCFGADQDSLLFDGATVDRPLPTGNQELAATFDQILNEQLAALTPTDLRTRCKALLLQQLTSGTPSQEELAEQVHMTSRTLHRKLAEQGLSFSTLLDETRYDLAVKYLKDPSRSVTEITFLLGFSEHSAFTRAFKRWSGQAPTSYRAQRQTVH